MTVSKMTLKEVPLAAELDRRLFSGECWSEADFRDSLSDLTRDFFVAYEGDRFLGVGGIQVCFDQGDVLTVGVDPDCRRAGVGSALLSAMVEAFRQRGGGNLFLEVRRSNLPARKLYEKFGFSEIGIRRNYYQDPKEDGVVYCLEVLA